MKILEVITLGEIGGAQTVMVDLLKGISAKQDDIVIHVVCGPGDYIKSSLEGQLKGTVFQVSWLVRNINPIKDLCALIKLIILFKKEKYDWIHLHSSKAAWLGRIAAYIAGVPNVCVTVHGLSFRPDVSSWSDKVYKFLEKRIKGLASNYVFVSPRDMKAMLELGFASSKCSLIPNGRPIPFIPPVGLRDLLLIEPEKPVITMVSRLTEIKNPTAFIRIAEQVQKILPPALVMPCFVLIGGGPLLEQCRQLIFKKNLQKTVLLLGEKEDASQYFWDSDIVMLTSNYEACPLVVIEAMAAGKPVVASNVGGVSSLVDEGVTGYLYDLSDEQKAAQRIIDLLLDKNLRTKMGRDAGERYRSYFTLEKMVKKYSELFGLD